MKVALQANPWTRRDLFEAAGHEIVEGAPSTEDEFIDLMRDPKVSECMVGRVSMILGKKNAEMDEGDEQSWKARAVFQGNNIRTKTGADPAVLFREVANAPASFVAARAALASAVLRQLRVSFRDAKQAFLQSVRGKDVTPTWAELPKSWWPDLNAKLIAAE